MKHLILLIFLPARILYRVPSSPSRHDNQEIDGEEGDADDNDAAADDTNATAAGVATVDNEDDYATMPTKLKLFPKKPTKKDSATTDAKPPPPPAAAAAATSFSIDATDPLTDNYYADGVYDYADGVFCINGTMNKGMYQV
jgi:hypothetical protein